MTPVPKRNFAKLHSHNQQDSTSPSSSTLNKNPASMNEMQNRANTAALFHQNRQTIGKILSSGSNNVISSSSPQWSSLNATVSNHISSNRPINNPSPFSMNHLTNSNINDARMNSYQPNNRIIDNVLTETINSMENVTDDWINLLLARPHTNDTPGIKDWLCRVIHVSDDWVKLKQQADDLSQSNKK